MRFVNSSLWRLLLFDTSSAFAHSASICRLYNQRVKSRLKRVLPEKCKTRTAALPLTLLNAQLEFKSLIFHSPSLWHRPGWCR